ncbi:MAG TPA: lysophospholipid acyltransferase family protein, partial [Ktedonobacterales bacterium]|nr:lysophospholipid acyltransferase family protein [Ktedonobacterales bacterium]
MSANTPASSSQPSQPARPSRSATPASREDRVGQESKGFYAFAKLVVRLIIPLLARLRVVGLENVPASGPVILAQNHIAWVDIPLASLKVPRVSHYMAKIELFGQPLLGGIMRLLGAFPVRR